MSASLFSNAVVGLKVNLNFVVQKDLNIIVMSKQGHDSYDTNYRLKIILVKNIVYVTPQKCFIGKAVKC